MNFGPLTAKIGPEFSPTLHNHRLLGGGGHQVGLPLGVPTFLVVSVSVNVNQSLLTWLK